MTIPTSRFFNLTGPSTPHQRLHIASMLIQLELPVTWTNLQIGRYFELAKLPVPAPDRKVDDVLNELTKQQASELIRVLLKETRE